MAAAAARAAGRRAGAHAHDLRPACQTADRLGQRPANDRARRAAVDVVARRAGLRHVAFAVARELEARVCRAQPLSRRAMRSSACDAAAPGPSRHVAPAQLAVQLHCHEPIEIDDTSPARPATALSRSRSAREQRRSAHNRSDSGATHVSQCCAVDTMVSRARDGRIISQRHGQSGTPPRTGKCCATLRCTAESALCSVARTAESTGVQMCACIRPTRLLL